MKEIRVYLVANYQARDTKAIFGDDLTNNYTRESGEQYFRQKLSGRLTFVKSDYDWIMNLPLDTKIVARLYWDDMDPEVQRYMSCFFYRTDCEIDEDNKIISVEPDTDDDYTDFLGALDKEVDLIKLAPRITPVQIDKRPCLQVYTLGDSRLTNILSNMSWEQDCNIIDDAAALVNTYRFKQWDEIVSVVVSGASGIPSFFSLKQATPSGLGLITRTLTNGTYRIVIATMEPGYSGGRNEYTIYNGTTRLYYAEESADDYGSAFPRTVTLNAVQGTGTCTLQIDVAQFFVRMISDVERIGSAATFPIPDEDITDTNRNYSRVSPVPEGGDLTIAANDLLSTDPTRWGIYQPGQYYTSPLSIAGFALPVCHNRWGRVSYWMSQSVALDAVEKEGRRTVTLKDAYSLTDVFNAVLAEIAPSLTLSSEFLNFADPLDQSDPDEGMLLITPKSNLLNINYTQPAQKAPITMRQLLDMMRTVYRCYWALQGGALRIEHVEWFRRGGSYSGSASIGADLTANKTVRNNKPWSYLNKKYTYDKAEMPWRYEFGWMDDATEPFEGEPLEMVSNFVNKESIERFDVNNFSSDVDFLLLNPNAASKDGFVIMKAGGENVIATPIVISPDSTSTVLMDYETTGEESIDVTYTATDVVQVWAMDAQDNPIALVELCQAGSSVESTWVLPAGTKSLFVRPTTTTATFTLEAFYPPYLKVLYQDYNPGGYTAGYNLQNGRLAFSYLRRYYLYDMPCYPYRIGDSQLSERAIGIAKNKVQDVLFPCPTGYGGDFDPESLVKTGLGNGRIRKLSINLSSRMIQATLEYDTE